MSEFEMQKQIKELQEQLELERRANKILDDLVGELKIELAQVARQRDAAIADMPKDCRLCAKSSMNNGTGETCKTICKGYGENFVYRGLILRLNTKGKNK